MLSAIAAVLFIVAISSIFAIILEYAVYIYIAVPGEKVYVLTGCSAVLIFTKIRTSTRVERGFVTSGCADDLIGLVGRQFKTDIFGFGAKIAYILPIIPMNTA